MYRCIVTGLGGRGLYWVQCAHNDPRCEIVGYVEPVEANRKRAIARQNVPEDQIFPTLGAALQNVKADFVLDVTPPAVHHQIAQEAFDAGLHVLGEKPLSDDYNVARQVVEYGRERGRKHMITQNYRFGSFPRTTRQLLAEGLIGQPGQCDIQFYIPWADSPGSHYVTQPYMLINDMMVHHFDMLRYVLGAEPESVHAITWNHPWGWHQGDAAHAIVFFYPHGLVATHVACGCAVGSQTGWNGDWRIEGPLGSIDWDKDQMRHTRLHRTERPIQEALTPISVPPADQAILDEFFAAIEQDREPECSAADNLKSLAMVFAAIKSAQEGRRVRLAELA
ncbi:MAG TPA: Gfo/Idh/MocA family oxidoreductase [Chthonomonadaceae bacterium]|nr:Gfo/Idh/MocA family oxidoreductase [Chthonomonadaceae bacterium]